ncbi:DUF3325 domain-containing protein [Shewanella algae]|uniref:DUF3325 domain-containing protein n=1 Tax=Shewanella algae TaxID=38313 RepID=UPI0004684EBC|nr:DUF3325 domain-containing protein [Shewanella algae]NKZ43681.1 DUF3325 domain-containing protein [Shewanella algae]QTE76763.1 DUF3325 domain-containing protein [Shewanella algae]
MMIALIALTYLAFGLLAISMFGHFREAMGRAPKTLESHLLYAGGWLALLASFVLCGMGYGWGYGSILFFGLMTLAALPVVLQLSYLGRSLPKALMLAPVVFVVGWFI